MVKHSFYFSSLFVLNILIAGNSPSSAGRFVDAFQGRVDDGHVSQYRVYAKERCEKYNSLKDELQEKISCSTSLSPSETIVVQNKEFLFEQLDSRLEKWKGHINASDEDLRVLLQKKQKNHRLLSTETFNQRNMDTLAEWGGYFDSRNSSHYEAYVLNIYLNEESKNSEGEGLFVLKIKGMLHADENKRKREAFRNAINNRINEIVNFDPKTPEGISEYPKKLYIVESKFVPVHAPSKGFTLDHANPMISAVKEIDPYANVGLIASSHADSKFFLAPYSLKGVDKEDAIFNYSYSHEYPRNIKTLDLFNGQVTTGNEDLQKLFRWFVKSSTTFKKAYESYKKSQSEDMWNIDHEPITLADMQKAPLFFQELFHSYLCAEKLEYFKDFLKNSKSIFCNSAGNDSRVLASTREGVAKGDIAAEFFAFPEMKERGIAVGNLKLGFKEDQDLDSSSNKAGDCASVFVCLPGDIYAYVYDDGFIQFMNDGGTSVASARLAGYSHLLNNLVPQASPLDVREAILRTAQIEKLWKYKANQHGQGVFNFGRALNHLKRKFKTHLEGEKESDPTVFSL